MTLFIPGLFKSSAGLMLNGKIDCDGLTDDDLDCCAEWIIRQHGSEWRWVEGVPRGGTRLATALHKKFISDVKRPTLIIDDVMTTGASMERQRAGRNAVGVVIFQRGPSLNWVHPLFVAGID